MNFGSKLLLTAWLVAAPANLARGLDPSDTILRAQEHQNQHGVLLRTSGGLSPRWSGRRYQPENLWAYQTLAQPAVPWQYVDADNNANPIDAFIYRKLRQLDLAPSPRADRRTLIRRATFDLLGLPPTPKEVEQFVNDPASDKRAFGKVVSRLLDRPQYGEQWGRHWLDVVRYADTAGLANDFERPHAWRYRDYVIRSFNTDKPYDRFVKEQIAGDEIDPNNPELLVATGFLRLGPWEQTGMSVAKITRQQFLDDVTDSVAQVFLAHPLQCARCHDHKFDPIPTRDYYRIQAVLATTQFAERDAPFLPEENVRGFEEENGYLEQRIQGYRSALEKIRQKEARAARHWHAERGLEYAPRGQLLKKGIPEEKIAPRHIGLSTRDFGMDRICRKNLTRHRWELDRFRPFAMSVYSGKTRRLENVTSRLKMPNHPTEGTLEETAILAGGDLFSPTRKVAPGVLSVLSAIGSAPNRSVPHRIPTTIHGRRRALAEWIARPDNPLTVRSIVNRIWQYHFGQGIARNANNFGAMGKKPTHPQLLDWLAVQFIQEGWSIKAMHRRIMASDTYCRSGSHPHRQEVSTKDPDHLAYALFQPRRLTAEELRDSLLAVSGELNPEMGGIPVHPEINREAALQPRQIMGTYAPAYQPSPRPKQRNRRSIYAARIRGLQDPLMEVFNQPSSDNSCERRGSSTVAPQALALWNGQNTYDRSLAMAARLLKETNSPRQAVTRAFDLAFGRPPSGAELQDCLDHWHKMTAVQSKISLPPQTYPVQVVRHAIEEMSGEPFSFVETLEVYADYVPDLKPWDADPQTRALADVCLILMNTNEFVYVY